MKQCSKCGEWKAREQFSRRLSSRDGLQPFCRRCNSAMAAEWNRSHPEKASAVTARWGKENPLAKAVHKEFARAVKDGRVVKAAACEDCGRDNTRLEGHHDDYSKPLEVRWLCGSCHRLHHKAMEKGEAHEAVRID